MTDVTDTQGEALLTVDQTAKEFGVSRKTMTAWIVSGDVKSIKYPSGRYRVRKSEVARCLAAWENGSEAVSE